MRDWHRSDCGREGTRLASCAAWLQRSRTRGRCKYIVLLIRQPLGSHADASRSARGTPGPSHTPVSALGIDSKSDFLKATSGLPSTRNADALGIMQIYCACKDTWHVFLLETGEVRGDVKPDV